MTFRTALSAPPSAFAFAVNDDFEPAEILSSANELSSINPSGTRLIFTSLFEFEVLKTETGIMKLSPGAANLGNPASVTISLAISTVVSPLPKLLPDAATAKSLPRPLNSGISSSVLITPFLSG